MGTVVDDLITRVFDEVRSLDEGELADYIPELAAVAPDSFGICIATVDGYVYEIGDSRIPFTIQSISKPFTYALALADRGSEAVAAKNRRRTIRRAVQRNQPRPAHRTATKPHDQCRGDHRCITGCRDRIPRPASSASARRTRDTQAAS